MNILSVDPVTDSSLSEAFSFRRYHLLQERSLKRDTFYIYLLISLKRTAAYIALAILFVHVRVEEITQGYENI